MEDPKVPFADTTARRAQLMAATERFKSSITDSVDSIKDDASEIGKTAAFVAGVGLAVYLVVNAILPKSDEYRYAEKYGEPEDRDFSYEEYDEDEPSNAHPTQRAIKQQAKKTQKSAAASGLIGGLITTVLTNIAREQLTGFLARIRQNNAINPTADPRTGGQYHAKATTEPAQYTTQL
ncbi:MULTISPECIES: hypothetical protein [Spirosoma]|uniref:DUF4235 domain-containing protein n=1 Tax=Spirosoma liriopis TaxID=2937440 RepID=A0ABT0HU39_9BACT|nr:MULTISPECIES: hypothetical protein [Spirosoma]MCK8495705.1 hypothetical protein [Spirosoma liriopis]UHG91399.1 hypothetical protein LQ777_00515 [Spirosoma oryzicola]